MAKKSFAKTAVAAALFLSMLLVPAVMASQARAAGQPDKFKVGVILTLSGPMAAMGLLEKDGLEIAAEDINKAGGVMVQGKKRPVELLFYDDEANPKKALDAAYTLINKHKVKVLVGIRMNAAIEAVQQISEKKKVLCLVGVASYPGVYLGKKYGILISDSGWTESMTAVRLLTEKPEVLKKHGISPDKDKRYDFSNKKVAYWGRDEVYCQYADLGAKEGFAEFGKKQNLEYVGGFMYPIGTNDVSPYVQRMMAQKPDIICVGLYIYEETLKLLRALKEMGYDFGPNGNLLLVNSNDDFNWAHVMDPLWKEGFKLMGNLSGGCDMPLNVAEKYPVRVEFLKKMKAKHNRLPGLLEDNGYDELLMLTKAAEKADTITDVDKLRKQILGMKFDGVRGPNQVFVTPKTIPALGIYQEQIVLPQYIRIVIDKNQTVFTGLTYKEELYWGRGVSAEELLIK